MTRRPDPTAPSVRRRALAIGLPGLRSQGFWASALRYGLAGVFNTLVGFGLILFLDLGLDVQPNLANAIGYAVGIAVSYVLSRLFVFRGRSARAGGLRRYLAAVALAFLANQAVLTVANLLLPASELASALAQACAAVAYSGALFLLSHYWAFAGSEPARPA